MPDTSSPSSPSQITNTGTQEGTPVATMGYGARESADAKRQQTDSQMAHDMPEDININAVVARSQTLTFDLAGKEFVSNSDFRQKVQDQFLARLGLK